ncbi:hypothetical protein Lalb_Chr08g0242221 [Lupinus albus]|uniref:Uncharacterized protein n=1 Tax=Lupinus albus TaxID=3870 RepID=A0A6A4Q5D0_LUPAL|nr:hypothetical protein Lalb_Chr08g0242221 [Lupinus albus]
MIFILINHSTENNSSAKDSTVMIIVLLLVPWRLQISTLICFCLARNPIMFDKVSTLPLVWFCLNSV